MSLPAFGVKAGVWRLRLALVGSLLAHLGGLGVLLALAPGPRETPTLLEVRPVQVWQALPTPRPGTVAPLPEVRPPKPPTVRAARPRVPVAPSAVRREAPAGGQLAGPAYGAVRPERWVARDRRGVAPGPRRVERRLRPASHGTSPSPHFSLPPGTDTAASPSPGFTPARPRPSPVLASQPDASLAGGGAAAVHGAGSGAAAAGRAPVKTAFLTRGEGTGNGTATGTEHRTDTGAGEADGGAGSRRGEAPGGAGGDHGGREADGGPGGASGPGEAAGTAGAGSASGGGKGSADGGSGGEGPSGPPALQYEAPPAYPAEAARDGIQGTVRIRAHIDTEGQVTAAEVVGSSGDPRLDEAARVAALAWRFRPATRGGRPVAAWVTRNVRFALDG